MSDQVTTLEQGGRFGWSVRITAPRGDRWAHVRPFVSENQRAQFLDEMRTLLENAGVESGWIDPQFAAALFAVSLWTDDYDLYDNDGQHAAHELVPDKTFVHWLPEGVDHETNNAIGQRLWDGFIALSDRWAPPASRAARRVAARA